MQMPAALLLLHAECAHIPSCTHFNPVSLSPSGPVVLCSHTLVALAFAARWGTRWQTPLCATARLTWARPWVQAWWPWCAATRWTRTPTQASARTWPQGRVWGHRLRPALGRIACATSAVYKLLGLISLVLCSLRTNRPAHTWLAWTPPRTPQVIIILPAHLLSRLGPTTLVHKGLTGPP